MLFLFFSHIYKEFISNFPYNLLFDYIHENIKWSSSFALTFLNFLLLGFDEEINKCWWIFTKKEMLVDPVLHFQIPYAEI